MPTPRRTRGAPPVLAVSGPSGAGKTRLLARLIPALARRGVTSAVVKHTRHAHPFDRPGKDTEVLRRAGAIAAAIEGPEEMAWFGPPAGGLDALVARMPPVGLVLAEGFRDAEVPRVEVHRRCIAREFLCARDPRVLAVVTDEPPPRGVPAFGADEVEPLADALCAALRLGPRAAAARPRKGAPAEGPLAAAPAREQRSARKRAHGRAPGKRTHGEEDEP